LLCMSLQTSKDLDGGMSGLHMNFGQIRSCRWIKLKR
jgi:hypothetical protein